MTLRQTKTSMPAQSATKLIAGGSDLDRAEQLIDDAQPEVTGFVQTPTIAAVAAVAALQAMIGGIEARPLEPEAAAKEQQAGRLDLGRSSRSRSSTRMHL